MSERFWSKVDKTVKCWNWLGHKNRAGYGVYGGKLAHRIVMAPIPKGLEVDHICRNRACVNQAHLRVVTHRENTLAAGSQTASAINARKTHCPKNHPYSGDNLYYRKRRHGFARECRACLKAANAKQYAIIKERRDAKKTI